MNHLLRAHAPITDDGWALIDDEARARLAPALAARRLVDFAGPVGWEYSAATLGRTAAIDGAGLDGVASRRRRVLPAVELRVDFALARAELADADRGADDVDLGPLDEAAHRSAIAENLAVFHGWGGVVAGMAAATSLPTVPLGGPAAYPGAVATAVAQLLAVGVGGPYGLALGNEEYRNALATAEGGGYPLANHLREILDGPIVWTPGITGGVVVSLRGGDFVFTSGQDLSVGYDSHDADVVRLYLQESFTFHVATPEAAVALGA